MTSMSVLADTVALVLFQNIREGMESGQIADLKTAQTEVEAAISKLNARRLLEGSDHTGDLIGKMLLEIGSLREKVAKCESEVTECQAQAEALKEETIQIVARTEACNMLVEKQQKENVKVLAAMEGMKVNITPVPSPCYVPTPSPIDATYPAPSRTAIVSFPGGPRTITIHPPGSPNYQSVIRDEKGDVAITIKGGKPLRREGAFRGPLEDIDWREIHRVYGRNPDLGDSCPPMPFWPDRSELSLSPTYPSTSARSAADIIMRQRQLSASMQTDAFGRVLLFEHFVDVEPPSFQTGSSQSSEDSPHSSAKPDTSTPCSAPTSLSADRSKKRTRHADEDEGAEDALTVMGPATPTPVKREASQALERPAKRKKSRSSLEELSAPPLSRSHSVLDLSRTV